MFSVKQFKCMRQKKVLRLFLPNFCTRSFPSSMLCKTYHSARATPSLAPSSRLSYPARRDGSANNMARFAVSWVCVGRTKPRYNPFNVCSTMASSSSSIRPQSLPLCVLLSAPSPLRWRGLKARFSPKSSMRLFQ